MPPIDDATIVYETLAHIVYPGQKLRDVVAGKLTRCKALCGAMVTRRSPGAAQVCRECFNAWRDEYAGQDEVGSREKADAAREKVPV